MLLQKLVEQHRVHSFIADCVRLAMLVASHQIGIYLFDFFSHEAKLWDTIRIKVFLVTEGHWVEREDRFARFVHGFDLVLEANGRDDRAKLAVIANYYSYASGDGYPRNSGDKGGRLR